MSQIFDRDSFIERLNMLSKEKGLSLNKVLNDCGYKDFVANLRKGSIPSIDKFLIIANYFKVDIGWLINGESQINRESQPNITYSSDQPSADEHEVGSLSSEEKILIENYRDMKEKDKIDVQRNIARKLSKDERIKSTTCPNTKGDMEIAEDIS